MKIKCEERYLEAMAHAEQTGDNSLQYCLNLLERYEENERFTIVVYKDFAPLSFAFDLLDENGNRIMNGGILYHGNPDQSYAFTFDDATGWQIHT